MINEIFKDTMANMKWTELQGYVDKNALVLLPIGVIEEHGPQLCLGTDILLSLSEFGFNNIFGVNAQ
jgi:creatinine amidohydrolase